MYPANQNYHKNVTQKKIIIKIRDLYMNQLKNKDALSLEPSIFHYTNQLHHQQGK